MQFSKTLLALAAAVSAVSAASVTFVTLDDETRTVYFTASAGLGYPDIDPITVSSEKNTTVTFPDVYNGKFYAIKESQTTDGQHMLGEVTFGGSESTTFFDVSAIDNPADKDNVKEMYPASALTPVSGCPVFPCNNAYYHPDDVQTKATSEVDLITTLGTA